MASTNKEAKSTVAYMSAATDSVIAIQTQSHKTWQLFDGEPLHAHFDCFSGAAGDMILAACIDAAGEKQLELLEHIEDCLRQGMPEIANEFKITSKQVHRSKGLIAATHVTVHSKYNHQPAPLPGVVSNPNDSHDHSHDHNHNHNHNHEHSHSHQNSSQAHHSHSHEHFERWSQNNGESNNDGLALQNPTQLNDSHIHDHNHKQERICVDDHHNHHSHSHSHSHENGPIRNLPQIKRMLENASEDYIPEWVKFNAIEAFTQLAHAEVSVHGASGGINAVHFHEVGAIDSIVDTVGSLLALHALGVTTVSCSRLPLGAGTVWTDHGLLPVPAPATLQLMKGMSITAGPPGRTGELVTPTAAALLKVLTSKTSLASNSFAGKDRSPDMTMKLVGVGAGTKDFDKHPNILRVIIGKLD